MSTLCSHKMSLLPTQQCRGVLCLKISVQCRINMYLFSSIKPKWLIFTQNVKPVTEICVLGVLKLQYFEIVTQPELQQTHTFNTHMKNPSPRGFYHMTVGTGALWDARLFSAVNRSHEATGAWLGVTGPESDTVRVCVSLCVCWGVAVIHLCTPLSTELLYDHSSAAWAFWDSL